MTSTISSRVAGFFQELEQLLSLSAMTAPYLLPESVQRRIFEDAGFMAGQNDPGRNLLKEIDGGPRLVDVGKEVAIPGPETGEVVITRKQDGGLREEEGQMAGGVAGRRDDVHGERDRA